MVKLYKGNLSFIHKQKNLIPNVYDKPFAAQFKKVYDNNDTPIKTKNLNAAQDKVNEVRDIAARSVYQMN
jgi:hypothetical protein